MEKEDDKLIKRNIRCFDFRSNFLVLISILLNIGKKDNKSFERDVIVLISFPILFVSTSFLVNIGKEMSLPGFRRIDTYIFLPFICFHRFCTDRF